MTANVFSTLDFMRSDHSAGLFPLQSTLAFVDQDENSIAKLINEKIFNKSDDTAFTSCPVAYALKDRIHLRRVLVLDPIASYYIYNFVWRNSARFPPARSYEVTPIFWTGVK